MGVAGVFDVVNDVSGRLATSIQEFGQTRRFEYALLTLKEEFDMIKAVLQDADEEHIRGVAVEDWLKSLRSASLMAENVLDDISTEALLQRLNKRRDFKYRLKSIFFSKYYQLVFNFRITHKLESIRKKLNAIASKRLKLDLKLLGPTSHLDFDAADEILNRETSPLIDSSRIFGRNEETDMVIKNICNRDIGKYYNGEILVYGIWGTGGVGKTTLAQLVYNHEYVQRRFDFRCWVCVSPNFQLKEIMIKIIESIDICRCEDTELDKLLYSLRDKLNGRRFLIVLDDVWIENDERAKWDVLSEALSFGSKESIVLMTTRSQTTCRIMANVPELQHKVSCLSFEDSWILFKACAFAQGRMGDDISELEPIGRDIVEKCQGIPLVVKTLGRLLWSKRSTFDWEHVRDNIWELAEGNVMPALKLTYDKLLPHVKRCFAYCCLFPKGYDMEKDVVIELWVVNGFIPHPRENNLNALGEYIFNYLVERSFFQAVNGRYKMDDLMHDLARYVSRDDCLLIEPGKEVKIPNEALHLSSSCPDFEFLPQDLEELKLLRSIFLFGVEYKFSINHAYLRVLYLCDNRLKTLPESISKLKNLKYLNLSYSSIEELPNSIIFLQNLQVLLLNFCYKLRKLPEEMRYMSSLRVLETKSCHSLLHFPFEIKEKLDPPRLTRFHVGKKIPKIAELGDLDHVGGELEISGLENVKGLDEAMSAKLNSKTNVWDLKLSWSNIYTRASKRKMLANDEKVLKGLEPNSSLEKLSIFFFMGESISSNWIVKLNNLVEIGFSGCKRCATIPPLGRLQKLKVIKLLGMDSLEGFHDQDMSPATNLFPRLKELHIFMCPKLISLPSNLSTLRVLSLEECGALISLPVKHSVSREKLKISGCKQLSQRSGKYEDEDSTKISHIPDEAEIEE